MAAQINKQSPDQCLSQGELEAYLSGKISRAARERLRAHLHTCELCREALEGLQGISSETLNAATGVIHSRIDRRLEEAEHRAFPWKSLAAAVAVFVLLGAGFIYFMQLRRSEPLLSDHNRADKQHSVAAEPFTAEEEEPTPVPDAEPRVKKPAAERSESRADSNVPEKEAELPAAIAQPPASQEAPPAGAARYAPVSSDDSREIQISTAAELTFVETLIEAAPSENQENAASEDALSVTSEVRKAKKSAPPVSTLKSHAPRVEEGIALYDQGSYEEARQVFEKLLNQKPSDQKARIYHVLCGFRTGMLSGVEKEIELLATGDSRDRYASEWLRLIYLSEKKELSSAIALLESISKGNGPYRVRAERLLYQLKR
jgi:tetratricopeptide (TPR) repeat protein